MNLLWLIMVTKTFFHIWISIQTVENVQQYLCRFHLFWHFFINFILLHIIWTFPFTFFLFQEKEKKRKEMFIQIRSIWYVYFAGKFGNSLRNVSLAFSRTIRSHFYPSIICISFTLLQTNSFGKTHTHTHKMKWIFGVLFVCLHTLLDIYVYRVES